jgi:hypothetical protein
MSLEDDAILRPHPRRSPMQLAQRRPARGAPRT